MVVLTIIKRCIEIISKMNFPSLLYCVMNKPRATYLAGAAPKMEIFGLLLLSAESAKYAWFFLEDDRSSASGQPDSDVEIPFDLHLPVTATHEEINHAVASAALRHKRDQTASFA